MAPVEARTQAEIDNLLHPQVLIPRFQNCMQAFVDAPQLHGNLYAMGIQKSLQLVEASIVLPFDGDVGAQDLTRNIRMNVYLSCNLLENFSLYDIETQRQAVRQNRMLKNIELQIDALKELLDQRQTYQGFSTVFGSFVDTVEAASATSGDRLFSPFEDNSDTSSAAATVGARIFIPLDTILEVPEIVITPVGGGGGPSL